LSLTTTTVALRPAARQGLGAVAAWLIFCCAMVFAMVVLGGITRLTLSGLSITQWHPVIGIVPPLSAAQWVAAFGRYKEVPEYRLVHSGMTLGQFKGIYFWEYLHRLWGRLIGLAYAGPLAWFWCRGRLPRRLKGPLVGILGLGFAQGFLGWYMVESGLADRVEVSQYRLTAHLALALLVYAAMLWVALGIIRDGGGDPRPNPPPPAGEGVRGVAPPAGEILSFSLRRWRGRVREGASWRRAAEFVVALVALTIAAGGFTAGLHAGLTYNTFPLMDGRLVPSGYGQLHPFWRNWFENVAAVQFDHRLLAMTTLSAVVLAGAAGLRAALPRPARAALGALLAAALLQVSLGISTLLLVVPIPLAVCHQAGAVILLTAAIVFRHTLRLNRAMW
jgi:heme a synthase